MILLQQMNLNFLLCLGNIETGGSAEERLLPRKGYLLHPLVSPSLYDYQTNRSLITEIITRVPQARVFNYFRYHTTYEFENCIIN